MAGEERRRKKTHKSMSGYMEKPTKSVEQEGSFLFSYKLKNKSNKIQKNPSPIFTRTVAGPTKMRWQDEKKAQRDWSAIKLPLTMEETEEKRGWVLKLVGGDLRRRQKGGKIMGND